MRKSKISNIIFSTIILFCFAGQALLVYAFESTSGHFENHAGDIESIVGLSTSASFKIQDAGGQNATGISSMANKIYAGILYWFSGLFVSSYNQVHYRWREDTGCSESSVAGGCWPVNEDTQYVSFPKNTFKRLRFEMANNGGWTRGVAPVFTLEVAQTVTCSSGTYVAVPTTYGSNAWAIATSTNITDGAATTNVGTPPATGLTDVGSTFVAGQTKTLGNTTAAITIPAGSFTEIEYALVATSNATNANPYCFRLTNNGVTTNFSYSNYAVASIASGLPATGSLDSAVFDTFATSGANQGPAYNSIMWNGSEGTGKVRFQFAASDCANGATNYPTCNSGAWTFYGSSDGGSTCSSGAYYDTLTSGAGGGPGKPVEIACAASQSQNNKRYFKYRVQICSLDCSGSGQTSPIVNGVIVNWAP